MIRDVNPSTHELFARLKAAGSTGGSKNSLGALTPRRLAIGEELLGAPLPELFKEMYLACGNGGFGPDVRPLVGTNDEWDKNRTPNPFTEPEPYVSVVLNELRRRKLDPNWPKGILGFCDLGCGMELCVDTNHPGLPVVRFEGIYADTDENCLNPLPESIAPVSRSLLAWIEAGCPT
jgi:hypothetical protein